MNTYYNRSFRLKTQKAIEMINQHEIKNEQFYVQVLGRKSDPEGKRCKFLNENTWNRMQFNANSLQIFIIQSNFIKQQTKTVLKIVIKSYTGPNIVFGLSKKNEPLPINNCQYSADSEIIFKINQFYHPEDKIYLTFHSKQLTIFKLKYQFTYTPVQKETTKERVLSLQNLSLMHKYSHSSKILSYSIKKEQKLMQILQIKTKLRSPKNIRKQELLTGRLKSIQNQKARLANNKQKRQNMEIYNEKCQALQVISHKCKGLVEQYHESQIKRRVKLNINSSALGKAILMINFFGQIRLMSQNTSERIQLANKYLQTLIKIGQRFKRFSRKILEIEPNGQKRIANTITQFITCEAKCVKKVSMIRAGYIMKDCFQRLQLSLRINTVMNKSTDYRIKIRKIQKYWKIRNANQIAMFNEYINHQILEILKKQPSFMILKEEFYKAKVNERISWQYLKEISCKIKNILHSYQYKIEEIQQMKEANVRIVQFNKVCLKKNIKKLLIVAQKPSFPVTRYFRDIAFMKSLIRSWFQIQYRKYSKKNKKQIKK